MGAALSSFNYPLLTIKLKKITSFGSKAICNFEASSFDGLPFIVANASVFSTFSYFLRNPYGKLGLNVVNILAGSLTAHALGVAPDVDVVSLIDMQLVGSLGRVYLEIRLHGGRVIQRDLLTIFPAVRRPTITNV